MWQLFQTLVSKATEAWSSATSNDEKMVLLKTAAAPFFPAGFGLH